MLFRSKENETANVLSLSLVLEPSLQSETTEDDKIEETVNSKPQETADVTETIGKRKCHSVSEVSVAGESSSPSIHSKSMIENAEPTLDKVDSIAGKYKCGDCGKEFKFLTYLKSHQNSKLSCKKSETWRRRSSMVFSTSMNFSKLQS